MGSGSLFDPDDRPGAAPPQARRGGGWIIALSLVLSLAVAFLALRSARMRGGWEQMKVSRPAVYGWKLMDLDGQEVNFESYRGRPVFLNLWATWCPPCVEELPSIGRLASNPQLGEVAFVCVAAGDDLGAVRQFARRRRLPMTFLVASDVPDAYATDAIPATFFIAPDGRVVRSEVGGRDWDDPDVVRQLRRLAGE